MAIYHFWMPYQFHWTDKLQATPPAIAWGAIMINFCFSVLLVWGAAMTVLAAFRWAKRDALTRCAVWGMGTFWVLNAGYQALFPMPLPENLRVVGWFLLGFAVLVAFLYTVAIAVSLPTTSRDAKS
jgi:membrane-associated phospholipid phosphatase